MDNDRNISFNAPNKKVAEGINKWINAKIEGLVKGNENGKGENMGHKETK